MNAELLAFYTTDRAERIDQPRMGTPEYTAMRERDTLRRLRAAAIVSALEAPEAADLYHAALLFQHGDEPQDAWRAYQLAREATERGEGRARWLTAAAYDHWLMYQSKPQKYGTQYVHDMMASGIGAGMSRHWQSRSGKLRRPPVPTRRSRSTSTMHPGG
jgi:hypothetical protein